MFNFENRVSKKVHKNPSNLIQLVLFLIVTTFSMSVFADGFVLVSHVLEGWELGNETEQKAIITYEDGIQKMILRIGLAKEQQKEAVWIFPVPSDPEDISIDITTNLPQFEGVDIIENAESNIKSITYGLLFTQIVPIPPIVLVSSAMLGMSGVSMEAGFEPGVTVHQQVVKEGVTSEVITAKTASSIYEYLHTLGLDIDEGMLPVLDQYIGKKASFIVSWISGDVNGSESKGVCVSFPTEKLYFPLIPTSIYGKKVVPATIYVSGLVSPQIYDDISPFVTVDYMSMEGYWGDPDPIGFCQQGKSCFTKIRIKVPSERFTEDLWISRTPPLRAVVAWLFSEIPFEIMFLLSLFFFSALTGVLSGSIAFCLWEPRIGFKRLMKFALIGLSNCLTIIGLIVCMKLMKFRQIPQEDKDKLEELRSRGYKVSLRDPRKTRFVLLFIVIFCTLVPLAFFGITNFISG
ncbi:MAG: hypothetical protein DRP56_07405 [Planctomycetota bacterium]|nr:MAG: hypothetical protein DRP56_07405 [Planctomycetota bacterium]